MKEKQTHSIPLESTCKITDEICLPDTKLPRVVIVGGGFAGLALVEKLKHKEVQVVLLDKNNFHQFQPLLYQVATSALEPGSVLPSSTRQLASAPHKVSVRCKTRDTLPRAWPSVSTHLTCGCQPSAKRCLWGIASGRTAPWSLMNQPIWIGKGPR